MKVLNLKTVFLLLIILLAVNTGEVFAATEWVLSDAVLGSDSRWQAECSMNDLKFSRGDRLEFSAKLQCPAGYIKKNERFFKGFRLVLLTERLFDENGRPLLFNNNFMSTVLTPSGLPIENSYFSYDRKQGSNDRLGFSDFVEKSAIDLGKEDLNVKFAVSDDLPQDLAPGYYRFHVRFIAEFFKDGQEFSCSPSLIPALRLDPENYQVHPFHEQLKLQRKQYPSPVWKVGKPKTPHMIWALFTATSQMGTHGVIAREDEKMFKISPRHSVPDRLILAPGIKLNLEPDFPAMFLDKAKISFVEHILPFCAPIDLDYKSGEFAVSITLPDGKKKNLGKSRFMKQRELGGGSGTEKYVFEFKDYGKYTISMKGWIKDVWGNRYEGGGTYDIWIAHRFGFATSVKPGSPFETGDCYPTSVFVHPPFPAKVSIDVEEYIDSQEDNVSRWHVEGKASRFGYFYAKEKICFDRPGEYIARVWAEYQDPGGRLWLGNQVGASIVAPKDSPLTVYGKKYAKDRNIPEARYDLKDEGGDGTVADRLDYPTCTNLKVPFYSGDVMYIAADNAGTNAIDGMLSAYLSDAPAETKSLYPPYNYPESISDHAYFYFSAIRPGIMTRTLVSDPGINLNDSYWPTSPAFNSFGNQYNATSVGDYPQDIYRFMGGFVYKQEGRPQPYYGIYASMAMVIPNGSDANRVVAPFSEPLVEVNGREFDIFEAGAPTQGVIYEQDEPLGIGGLVFPAVEGINCRKEIVFPDGKTVVSEGKSNKIGVLQMSPNSVIADVPGVYTIKEHCWKGDKTGDVLGTNDGSYHVYVDDKSKEKYFKITADQMPAFDPAKGLLLKISLAENIKDPKMTYSVIMPGCVMDEGELSLENFQGQYCFRPSEFNAQFPNYDFGKLNYKQFGDKGRFSPPYDEEFDPDAAELVDLVMMTFFLEAADEQSGRAVFDTATVMLRGNKIFIIEYER